MSYNNPFEAFAKNLSEAAPALTPAALQEALKPVQNNLKAWADLAQAQAQAAQQSVSNTIEAIKGAKDPQSAFEGLKASAEASLAMFTKNLKDVTALSVDQFNTGIDAVGKSHPAPEAFASVGKNLKAAASTAENTLNSMLEKGAAAAAAVNAEVGKARKAR
jgi:hypothetical protein